MILAQNQQCVRRNNLRKFKEMNDSNEKSYDELLLISKDNGMLCPKMITDLKILKVIYFWSTRNILKYSLQEPVDTYKNYELQKKENETKDEKI